jgi:hypothetical protein
MITINVEDLYMTAEEVAEYLEITRGRVSNLANAGQLIKLKGSVYLRSSVEAYKLKRGDKRGGRYPKGAPS